MKITTGKRAVKLWLLVGTVMAISGCQALATIDQNLYQAAESVSEKDRVTGQRSLSTAARGAQIQQGNSVIKRLLAEEEKAGRAINQELDSKQYLRLVRVFDRLHQVGHLQRERWKPLLIKRDSFNAFTTGGTYIVVHSGLMEQLKSDDELAAVVGHEIAHTVANHLGESNTHRTLSRLTASRSAKTNAYQAAFTHENEREADRIGILYSALAGFDPFAAQRIWQRQYNKSGNGRALFLHDHPVNAERAVETGRVAKKVVSYYKPGQSNPKASQLIKNNTLWRYQESGPAAGEGGGVVALLSTAADALIKHETVKHEASRQQRTAQFVKAVEQHMKRLGSQAISKHQLKVLWQFQANRAPSLVGVTMGLMVKKDGKVIRTISHVKEKIRAGGKFVTVFNLPATVNVDDLRRLPVRFYVDDAVPEK